MSGFLREITRPKEDSSHSIIKLYKLREKCNRNCIFKIIRFSRLVIRNFYNLVSPVFETHGVLSYSTTLGIRTTGTFFVQYLVFLDVPMPVRIFHISLFCSYNLFNSIKLFWKKREFRLHCVINRDVFIPYICHDHHQWYFCSTANFNIWYKWQ